MKNLRELGKVLTRNEQQFITGGGPGVYDPNIFGCWDGPVEVECQEVMPDPHDM